MLLGLGTLQTQGNKDLAVESSLHTVTSLPSCSDGE